MNLSFGSYLGEERDRRFLECCLRRWVERVGRREGPPLLCGPSAMGYRRRRRGEERKWGFQGRWCWSDRRDTSVSDGSWRRCWRIVGPYSTRSRTRAVLRRCLLPATLRCPRRSRGWSPTGSSSGSSSLCSRTMRRRLVRTSGHRRGSKWCQ